LMPFNTRPRLCFVYDVVWHLATEMQSGGQCLASFLEMKYINVFFYM
jgi:hypothetical protein